MSTKHFTTRTQKIKKLKNQMELAFLNTLWIEKKQKEDLVLIKFDSLILFGF